MMLFSGRPFVPGSALACVANFSKVVLTRSTPAGDQSSANNRTYLQLLVSNHPGEDGKREIYDGSFSFT